MREQGNLTRLLLEQHTRALLPQRSVTPFGGDALEYVSFMQAFQHNIESKLHDERDKYYYLEQYTINDANKMVKSCMHMEYAYSRAKELLRKKFGDGYKVAEAFIKKATSWPDIKVDDPSSLNRLSLFLIECHNVLTDLNYVHELDHTANIRAIVMKLPYRLRVAWRVKVDQIMEDGGHAVKFKHLVDFVERQARIVSNPVYGDVATPREQRDTRKEHNRNSRNRGSSFAANVSSPNHAKSTETTSSSTPSTCMFCNGGTHDLATCRKLESLQNDEKINFLKANRLCFGCLRQGSHVSKNCTKRLTCKKCSKRHPTILHRDSNELTKTIDTTNKGPTDIRTCTAALNGAGTPAMVPVKVHSRQSGRTVITYAFLDDGSNAVFCSEGLRSQLGVTGKTTKLQVQTLLGDHKVDTQILTDLEVTDIDGHNRIQLPNVYTQQKMPVTLEDVVSTRDLRQWPYLNTIDLQDYTREVNEVGILIGSNVPKATEPWEIVHSQNDGPYAYRTLLGWIVCGLGGKSGVTSNRILVRGDLQQQLVQMYNHDFNEKTVDDQPEKSVEDQRFMDSVTSTIQYSDGHYEIGLPLKNPNMRMPNNKVQAEQRAAHLKQKLKKNQAFFKEYNDFMYDMINNDYAERVPHGDCSLDGRKWYIPHHGVYHPQKQKLRVVFDCSAKYHGTSLNDQLLQGPDLTSTLIGVLTRFRQDTVALMADIKAMFYQVRVPKADRDLLRFLWWPGGDLERPMEEYRMNVHLFGATSSPSCANFALQRTATEAESKYDQQVKDTLYHNFYVDDCLTSVATEQEAVKLSSDLRNICEEGGFKLTKWTSNNRAVLQSIPESDRSKEIAVLDLEQDLPSERALGMLWSPEKDQFGFKIVVKDRPPTRRGILSMVSSVYDPLGFIGPVVLTAKQILQDLCRQQYSWDDKIPNLHLTRWQEWLVNLPRLSEFKVERCFKPDNFGTPDNVEIHHFSDASEVGYGTVSYLRLENDRGIHVSFLTSKARVAPVKKVTIPRLELTAATVAVRVNNMMQKELQIPVNNVHYWTDSTSVLHYIENETARFHTFVANRVHLIREGSTADQWHYIKSADNPADDCSRGLSVSKFLNCERWLKGPPFLWRDESEWPITKLDYSKENLNEDPEVKVTTSIVHDKKCQDNLDKLLDRYSNWHDLKKAVGWILRIRENLRLKAKRRKQNDNSVHEKNTGCLSVEELQVAENAIIQYLQQKSFPEEVSLLSKKPKEGDNIDHYVKRSSSIYRLDPRMTDGILRVGGRLNKAAMPEEAKHPAILPKNQHVTNLILRNIHESSGHSGRNHMLAQAQKKFWILKANSAARAVINKCVVCRRQRARMGEQKMADLPQARVTPKEPPFTRVGMDYFGPIEVKQGRSMLKRYGVIFTCLCIRAVHIEKADTLETDSCISAIRRFVARRGQVKQLVSDNGTNLVGAEKELRKHISQWNQSMIHESLLQDGINWVFNPPAASHFGGIWERQIRTIRKVMNAMLKEQRLTDESLQTLFCEVESVINSRPITHIPGEPGDLEALTPNHLLLLKVKPVLPPTIAEETGPYVKRRWKQVQYMADLFWKRWSKEYLVQLQERQKWVRPKANIKIGDVVLIVDGTRHRNQWQMARVISTMPDKEGLVRQVQVQTRSTTLVRPVAKLCLILEADE